MADRKYVKFRYPITAETTTTLDLMEYATDPAASSTYVSSNVNKIFAFSESGIVDQGTYSLRIQASGATEFVLRNVIIPIDISGMNSIKFSAFALRYGEKFNIRIHDATGGGVEVVDQAINVKRINQWVDYIINISDIDDIDKSAIDEIEFQANTNDDTTIYIDNLRASSDQDVVIITSGTFDLPDDITPVSNVVKTQAISGVNQRAKLGASRDTLNWNFPYLSRTDFDNLRTFFNTYTDWDLNPFEVTNLIENEITNVFLESWSTSRRSGMKNIFNVSMIERIAV